MKRFDQKLADQEYKEELNTLFDPVIKPINSSIEQGKNLLALTENQNKALETQNTLLGQTNKALEDQNTLTQELIEQDKKALYTPTPRLQSIVKQMMKQTNPQLELLSFDATKGEFMINKKPIRINNDILKTAYNNYRLTEGFVKFLTRSDVNMDELDIDTLDQIKNFLKDINYSIKSGDKKSSRFKLIKSLLSKPQPSKALTQLSEETELYDDAVSDVSQYELANTEFDKTLEGEGIQHTYVFLSSDPDFLLDRLEVLIAESSAGNKIVLDEILAIGEELHRQTEVSDEDYQNFLTNFGVE